MLKVFSTSFHDNIGWLEVFSVSEKILDTRHVLVGSTKVVQNKQQQKIAFNVDFIFTNCMQVSPYNTAYILCHHVLFSQTVGVTILYGIYIMSPCIISSNCTQVSPYYMAYIVCHHALLFSQTVGVTTQAGPWSSLPQKSFWTRGEFLTPSVPEQCKTPNNLSNRGVGVKNNWDTFWWSWVRNSLAQRRLSLCWSAELRLRMLFSLCEVLVVLWGSGRDNVANLHLIFFHEHSTCFQFPCTQ